MGTRKIYDAVVVTGSYVGSDGQEKKKYTNVGVVLQSDQGGPFLLLDRAFNPAGVPYDAARGNQIMVSMFEPRQEGQQGRQQSGATGRSAQQAEDGDIPF
jgi:hypothetical protein